MRARLIGATLTALLLGAVGCGPPDGTHHGADTAATSLSIIRHGNQFALTGQVADPAAKRALVDAVVTSADGAAVVDGLVMAPDATAPDFSAAAPVFETAAVIDDFALSITGDTVTLRGTVTKPAEAEAVEDAARDAWPRCEIVNGFVIGAPGTP